MKEEFSVDSKASKYNIETT